ncbi:MAG: uroporphyrinogen-III C-methyltransferase [Phycisphaeraceae bacterium]|nr:uroporphyrinogen-III C-methyltransferase [Phycisphaeraceae bacterium]
MPELPTSNRSHSPLKPASGSSRGRVALVGAGPGDPGYITVRGMELLRLADVVVFDALANPVLLDEAPNHAELIDAGKRAGDCKLTQDQINELLVQKAKEGKLVIRLKGGDPYLFGRGAEEMMYLARHGIGAEVVPGVTSGIAAPMTAGIPVTYRGQASTVTLIAGHEDPAKGVSSIDYAAVVSLIRSGGTACFYMGIGRLADIVNELKSCGLAEETPVAVVQWGTTPQQRSLRTTLINAARLVEESGLGAPAIVVVGAVAGLEAPGLDSFIRRPLFGQRILITRTRQRASVLKKMLIEQGALVLEAPTIEIVEVSQKDSEIINEVIRGVRDYDWLILTSVNGVAALGDRLTELKLDARHLAGVKIAAIGSATADDLRTRLGIRADLTPARYVAESLVDEMLTRENVQGKKCLLLRADIARSELPRLLENKGAKVTDLAVYHTKCADGLPVKVLEALRRAEVNWITFTSSSSVRNLIEILGSERALLEKVRLVSIGPVTSETIRQSGLQVSLEAGQSDIEGLVKVLCEGARSK